MLKLATEEQIKLYNDHIYPLQDEVFKLIQSRKFYLTGGTCLSRFYYQHRYSDDLDFFFDGNSYSKESFNTEYQEIEKKIHVNFSSKTLVNDEYFKRLLITEPDCELKVEFIFEPTVSISQRHEYQEFYLDSKENLVANKLTALYSRRTFKDYIDLFYLLNEFDLNIAIKWSEEKMVPLDYEGAIMALADGSVMQGHVYLLKKIEPVDFEHFVKWLTKSLLTYARTIS